MFPQIGDGDAARTGEKPRYVEGIPVSGSDGIFIVSMQPGLRYSVSTGTRGTETLVITPQCGAGTVQLVREGNRLWDAVRFEAERRR